MNSSISNTFPSNENIVKSNKRRSPVMNQFTKRERQNFGNQRIARGVNLGYTKYNETISYRRKVRVFVQA